MIEIAPDHHLVVYGAVLPWHTDQGDDPPESKIANWAEHDRVVPLQCSEWLSIRQRFPNAEFCAAGDFNTDLGTGSRYGTRLGIAALIRGMNACDLFCATAPGRIPDWRLPVLPIDHIVLPSAWADSARVVAAWPAFKGVISDHSGLVVEVTPTWRPFSRPLS
jgi:endonuclease/exonuclease/phosphatase family metal-dependent hydrolase